MSTTHDGNGDNWQLIADLCYEDYEELSESVHGWDFDFRQITSGRSAASLLQFGHSDFMISRFFLEQSYDQRGGVPKDILTFGICEEGIDETVTPNGIFQQDDILSFPADGELVAFTKPHFTGYTLSISEAFIDEVAESCGLQRAKPVAENVQKVLRCDASRMDVLRKTLRNVSRNRDQINKTENSSEILCELEFSIIQQLLLAVDRSQPTDKLQITKIKQARLQRALDYIDANNEKPITVLELAQASGSTVRTLEYIFRDYFDVTPKTYLMSRRLVAVRRDLHSSASLPTKQSISEIANYWGFSHMSQFAADYRRFFGELPSETVKRIHTD